MFQIFLFCLSNSLFWIEHFDRGLKKFKNTIDKISLEGIDWKELIVWKELEQNLQQNKAFSLIVVQVWFFKPS